MKLGRHVVTTRTVGFIPHSRRGNSDEKAILLYGAPTVLPSPRAHLLFLDVGSVLAIRDKSGACHHPRCHLCPGCHPGRCYGARDCRAYDGYGRVHRNDLCLYFAQKDRELIGQLREKGQQELDQAILELCSMRGPKCVRKLEETVYQHVCIDRCTGCGGVWLDPGELEALAPEAHTSWSGELLSRMTSRGRTVASNGQRR